MQLFERRTPVDRAMPAVHAELVARLHSNVPLIVMITIIVGIAGTMIAGATNDPLLKLLTGLGIMIGLYRIASSLAYARARRAAGDDADAAALDAARWEWRYGLGSIAYGGLLGALFVRTALVADAYDVMIIACILFGYSAGVVARASVRPVICVLSIAAAVIPALFALLRLGAMPGPEAWHFTLLALVMAAFALGSLETVRYLYRTTLGQLTARHDLAHMAQQDALTGLPNRIALEARFGALGASHAGDGRFAAVHFIDLDGFKKVNDRMGHASGDAVLREVARRLASAVRAGDILARVGGDEFIVLQPDIANEDEARALAERMIAVSASPIAVGGGSVRLGASVGIALAPKDGNTLTDLADRADRALYRAKANGRGGVAFAEPERRPLPPYLRSVEAA